MLVACTNLGLLYGTGVGVEQDLERARGSYQVACEGGDPLGCGLVALLDEARVPAGNERYSKLGQVGDAATNVVLSNALVELPDLGLRAVSDASGRVSFDHLPPGQHSLRAGRLGYIEIEGELDVPGNGRFVVLLDRAEASDLGDPGEIIGRVTDDGGRAISDVDVRVVGREERAISTTEGGFRVVDVEPGLLEVRFTRLGYAPRTALLLVQPGRTSEVRVAMSPEAIDLEPISVTVRSQFLERNGFYERSRSTAGFGRQFGPQELQAMFPRYVSDAVRRVPGIEVTDPTRQPVGFEAFATNRRVVSLDQGPCQLPVYVDGVRTGDYNLNQVDPVHVDAIEVYTGGNSPAQFQMMNPCGVVLIWTKR
jgi:hypothetical protein